MNFEEQMLTGTVDKSFNKLYGFIEFTSNAKQVDWEISNTFFLNTNFVTSSPVQRLQPLTLYLQI